jgi:glycosyltransferase involved in cell wall biosynthesis
MSRGALESPPPTYLDRAIPGPRPLRPGAARARTRGSWLAQRDESLPASGRRGRVRERDSPGPWHDREAGLVGPPTHAKDRSPAPVVLALVGFYPPAYRAGGPTRSVPRIVEQLGNEFEFRVITRNRDLGAPAPLVGVVPDRWVSRGSARCLYLSTRWRLMGGLITSVRRSRHDVIYLNSLFSIEFSLIPLLLRKAGFVLRRGLVIAPRGEVDDSALAIKHRRKRLYLRFVHRLHLLDDAIWHAATREEAEAIRHQFGTQARVLIARDIPTHPGAEAGPRAKQAGHLEVVFLSRIARMKNLDLAISTLATVRGSVNFDVFGPIEDRQYWAECQRIAHRLPSNVKLHYRGLVEPDRISQALGGHHLFFLPTRAESFGHAIVESLMAGCPVLISDQTPWRDLEARGAGWDLPLSRPDLFAQAIERCVSMTQQEFDRWSAGARNLGREIGDDPALDSAYRGIFRAALGPGGTTRLPTTG